MLWPMQNTNHGLLTTARRRLLDRLLGELLDMEAAERAARLSELCQSHPRLSYWLKQLVQASTTPTEFLKLPVARVANEALEAGGQAILPAGTRLGPWRILEPTGEGGMGIVYRAERADGSFEMVTAIKLIHAHRDKVLRTRLEQERQLLARLDHPNIARLVDGGTAADGQGYLVMEWVEGEDLSMSADRLHGKTGYCLDLFEYIAKAASHAHQRLVAHGDIKPANVRIRDDGVVKLMDFGIARLLNAEAQEARLVALTPSFAAPEQLEGGPITPSSDIWSLGALLYWMLTGRKLPAEHEQVAGYLATHGIVRNRELAAILTRACARDSEHRYRSAGELLADIERFRSYLPVAALAPTRYYRATRFVRRNPVVVSSLGMIAGLLVMGLTSTTVLYLQAEQARQEARQEQDRAEQQAEALEQVAGFQAEQLASLDVEAMGAGIRAALFERRAQVLDHDNADTRATAMDELEQSLIGINFTDLALEAVDEQLFRHSHAAIETQFEDQPLIQARLMQTLANITRDIGALGVAEQAQTGALTLRRQHLGDRHADTLTSIDEAGALRYMQGDFQQALELFEKALDGRRESLGDTHRDTLTTLNHIGLTKHSIGELDAALEYYQRALSGRQRTLGDSHPDTLRTKNNLGVLHRFRGEFDQALEYQARALEGLRQTLGNDDPKTINAIRQMGYLLSARGRLDEAFPYVEEGKRAYRRVLGDRHPQTLYAISDYGVALMQLDHLDEARVYLEMALEGRRKALGPDHPHMIFSLSFMADYYERVDNLVRAESYKRAEVELRKRVLDEMTLRTLRAKRHLGDLLYRLDRHDEAIEWAGRSTRGSTALAGPEHRQTAQARRVRGLALAANGQFKAAESDLLAANTILVAGADEPSDTVRDLAGELAEFYSEWARLEPGEGHERSAAYWTNRAHPD